MIIEKVADWGEYPMYRATYKGEVQYGVSFMQAISNMLGVISGEYNPEVQGL